MVQKNKNSLVNQMLKLLGNSSTSDIEKSLQQLRTDTEISYFNNYLLTSRKNKRSRKTKSSSTKKKPQKSVKRVSKK